ncbi:MAG: hypothetical protein II453_03820 [Alphaproteobacteria bacterium]|jgi:hypothetical protein|nr:hypothetical protein [Alphaproteobacteria bacterium]
MVEKIYYIENSFALILAIEEITLAIPCWVDVENVEMDYSKVTFKARVEDSAFIENKLAPLV